MRKEDIIKEIKKEKEKIKEKGVKKIGLFGSFAKNKQHKKSDVDILVTFESLDFDKYAELLILLEKILKRKVDLVIEKNLIPEMKYVKKEVEYVKL